MGAARDTRPIRSEKLGTLRTSNAAIALIFICLVGTHAVTGCQDPADRRDRIQRAVHEGRFEESVELLEKALKDSPNDSEFLYLYGIAQLGLTKPSLALWPLLRARDDPDWNTQAGLALIQVGILANDREQAIDAASRILEKEPENALARSMRAASFVETKAYEAALDDADWLIERDETNIAAHAIRLQALIGLERMEEIEDDFDELEKMWRDEAFPKPLAERYCIARAVFADEKGDREQAAERFEGCLDSFPNGRSVVSEAVSFFDRTGAVDRGTELLEAAFEREPTAIGLREALANRLRGLGETDAATQLLLEGTRGPGSTYAPAWAALAYHYFALERFEESVAAWKQLLKVLAKPDEAILFAYAEALIHADRFDEAEEIARQLPDSMGELVIGLILLEQGNAEKALEHFDAGQRLWPNNAVARYFAGLAAERAFDIDRAISEFRHSIRIDVKETPAALRLSRILEAEGNLESARTALQHYVRGKPTDTEGRLLALRIEAKIRGAQIIAPAFAAQPWPRKEIGSIVAEVAGIAMQTGDPERALQFLSSLLSSQDRLDFERPENADAMRAFVEALAASKRGDQAQQAIDHALKAQPEVAAFHEIHAGLLERLGAQPQEIHAAHARALELEPNHAKSLAALGRLATREGRNDEARRLFNHAATADPQDFDSRRRAAELAALGGDHATADQQLMSLLADAPTDARAATQLSAIVLEQDHDPARAVKLARIGVRFGGGSEAFAMLNRAQLAAGTPDQAVATFESAKIYRATDPSLHYYLGDALRAGGRRTEAIQSFEKAISLAEGHEFPERSETEAALAKLVSSSAAEDSP